MNPDQVDNFRVEIGRADKGRTFVRVVHLPSGKERFVVGLGTENWRAVEARLKKEIEAELSSAKMASGETP